MKQKYFNLSHFIYNAFRKDCCSDIITVNHRKYTHAKSFYNITSIANIHLLDIYNCLYKICLSSLSLTYYPPRHSSKSLVETWIDFMVCHYCHVVDIPWLAFKSTASRGKKKPTLVQISLHRGTDFSGLPNLNSFIYWILPNENFLWLLKYVSRKI